MDKKIDILTKDLDLPEDLNEYIVKKVERLYRFLDKINETTRGMGSQLNTQMSVESLLLTWLDGRGTARSFAQHT